jgi:hypothetical protein
MKRFLRGALMLASLVIATALGCSQRNTPAAVSPTKTREVDVDELSRESKLACASEAACQEARAWIRAPDRTLQLRLRHGAQPGAPLLVVGSAISP